MSYNILFIGGAILLAVLLAVFAERDEQGQIKDPRVEYCLSIAADPEEKYRHLNQEALDRIKQVSTEHGLDDPAEKLEDCVQAVHIDPENPLLLHLTGRLHLRANKKPRGVFFLERAANLGYLDSQRLLFEVLASDEGELGDPRMALYWFWRATETENYSAYREKAFEFIGTDPDSADLDRVIEKLTEKAGEGDPTAQVLLGSFLLSGKVDEQGVERAIENYAAARDADPAGMYHFGMAALFGQPEKPLPKRGADMLMAAYERGESRAAFTLGRLLESKAYQQTDWAEASSVALAESQIWYCRAGEKGRAYIKASGKTPCQ